VSPHADIGPELRALAQAILDRLDPAVRAAAAMAAESLRGPGRCQQVWCPVCALAALVSGEQHPLLTVIAEHSVTLMSMVRAMAEPHSGPDRADPQAPGEPAAAGAANGQADNGYRRYEHIPIVVEPASSEDPIP
jgi:hypothetical protein